MMLLKVIKPEDLNQVVVGSDKDIGGFSEAAFDYDSESHSGKFQGKISLDLPSNPNITRSGYAAFRTRLPKTNIFGREVWDTSLFKYLSLRVKGDSRKYFVNLMTDSVVNTDIYQHRLFLQTPGEWETIDILFTDFILTNNGQVQEQQIEMDREKVTTVGISLLDRQAGPFKLHVEWIKACLYDGLH